MSKWGQNDQSVTANSTTTIETSKGAPIGTQSLVYGSGKGTNPVSMAANAVFGNTSSGSKASVDVNMYGNTTVGAFINNMAVGVFGVNATMLQTTGGGLILGKVTYAGSGYAANAAVTLTVVNGGTGASGNTLVAVGRVANLIANAAGTGYITPPTVAIAAPAAININANTTAFEPTGANSAFSANTLGVTTNTFISVATANTIFPTPGQKVLYSVPASNTALSPLVGGTYYYIAFSNTTVVSLAATASQGLANTPINTLNPGAAAMTGELANTYDVILLATANSLFLAGDQLTYGVPTGNTPVAGLSSNTSYYVSFSNTTALALSTTNGGANISFSPNTTSTQVHTLQGTTATGYFDVSGAYPEVTHAGWVVRREGTGGRAGRVHYETLVAMHSIGVNGTTATGIYGTASQATTNTTADAIV